MKRIIGIDPGKEGGIVVLDDGVIVQSYRIPYEDKRVDTNHLRRILAPFENGETAVYLEERATFGIKVGAYDYNYGLVEATFEPYFDMNFAPVRNSGWQKQFCAGMHAITKANLDSKKRVQTACIKTFGLEACQKYLYNQAGRFHDGLSDAAGIAYYGWLVEEQKGRVMSRVVSVNGVTTKQRSSK